MTTPESLTIVDSLTIALVEMRPVRVRVPQPRGLTVSPVRRAALATIEHTGAGPPPRA